MKRPRSTVESLSRALRTVVGEQLRRSFNGQEVWHDERTWRELAGGLIRAFAVEAEGAFVIVGKEELRELVADANQMRLIRRNVEAYKSLLSAEKREENARRKSPYARWAAEHMKGPG